MDKGGRGVPQPHMVTDSLVSLGGGLLCVSAFRLLFEIADM